MFPVCGPHTKQWRIGALQSVPGRLVQVGLNQAQMTMHLICIECRWG